MNISPVADDLRRMTDAVVAVIDKIGKHRRPRRGGRVYFLRTTPQCAPAIGKSFDDRRNEWQVKRPGKGLLFARKKRAISHRASS
jgi:hypothetical protein